MTTNDDSPGRQFAQLNNAWPDSYAWAIEQMPGPAYCCSRHGHVVHSNGAAAKIWGEAQAASEIDRWDRFAALLDTDGNPLAKDVSPAARAGAGDYPPPTELFALCHDGQLRRVVVHAKPVFDDDGAIMGSLCCLTDVSEKRWLQDRARDAASAREDFLGMLAHELRNPLAPIMSIAALLQRRGADPATTKLAIVVERQTKQLARFIGDLLDASRVARPGDLKVEPRMCTEDDILALALDAVEHEVQARSQRLVVEVNDRDAELHCDPERVAQALGNVLCNASAFTPDGEQICLHIYVDGDLLRAEVVDCGAGIAAEDLPHVFEPFERRAVPPGRAPVGAGLGLTIAKGVCEAHGGSIQVRSPGLGQGTTVSLALPVAGTGA